MALAGLVAALDGLIGAASNGALEQLDDSGLVAVLQGFERVRNRMPLVDHQLVAAVSDRGLAERYCQGRVPRLLVQALRISAAEAGRRVRARSSSAIA